MMKAAMLALVALAMLVAASIISVAESVVTQNVANRASVITKFPGCVILGHHDWKDSPMSRDFAEDAHVDGVVSAGACQDICFESWKNSKFRGIQVHKSSSYQAIFRHEGCYVENTARWDCEKSRAGDTNQFKQNTISGWTVMPCYRGQMTDWRESSYWYVFDQFKYNSYSSDIRTATTGATGSHPPDKLTVKVADSPYICSWARSNQDYEEATVNQVPCLGWAYDSAMQRCSMSSTAPKKGSYTRPDSTTTRVTGSLYCENDFEKEDLARKIANVYETPGCMVKDIDWNSHDIGRKQEVSTPHHCRRLCQENANCVVFAHKADIKTCWLKRAKAATNEIQVDPSRMHFSGLKDCHTCLPGYYITNSDPGDGLDSCEICPIGFYCANGEKTPCPGGKFCAVEGLESPLEPSDTNACESEKSGTACEHNVCRDSALGKHLSGLDYQPQPSNFDFSEYAIPTQSQHANGWALVQTFSSQSDASVSFMASFNSMIHQDVVGSYSFQIFWKDTDPTETVENEVDTCEENFQDKIEAASTITLSSSAKIGDEVEGCVSLVWAPGLMKPDVWGALNDLSNTELETAKSCTVTKIRFHARGNFLVNDINGNAGSNDVVLAVKVGSGTEQYLTTNGQGRITGDLYEDSTNEYSTEVTIISANKTGIDTDIKLCPLDETCTLDNALTLPASFDIEHLNEYDIRLVDTLSRSIKGTIKQSFGEASCDVSNVLVEAFNAGESGSVAIAANYSESDGSFVVSVPHNTETRLVFTLEDHTFGIDGTTYADFLATGGYQVSENIAGVQVWDETTRALTLLVGSTQCGFNVGGVNIDLEVQVCPEITLSYSTDTVETVLEVPAANYILDVAFSDDDAEGTLRNSFEFQFPVDTSARHVNLTSGASTVSVLHEPEPEIGLHVESGNLQFDTAECTSGAFDDIVEGSQTISLRVTSSQTFNDQVCAVLPPNTTIEVASELAPEIDIACDTNEPCTGNFSIGEVHTLNRSVVYVDVVAGEPKNPTDGDELQDYVRKVTLYIRNDKVWSATSTKTWSALILGEKTVLEDKTLAFVSENSLPLEYVYSPPGGEGSFSQLTYTGTYTTQTSMQAVVEKENGIGLGVSVSASLEAFGSFVSSSLETTSETVFARVLSYDDQVRVQTASQTVTLATSSEEPGSNSDMVYFMGGTSTVTEAVSVSLDEASCSIFGEPSIVWGSKVSSLVYYSRSACQSALDFIEKTIEVEKDDPESESLVEQARQEQQRWQALLRHWDLDKLAAYLNPVNLQTLAPAASLTDYNRLQLSGSSYEFTKTRSVASETVVDYSSWSRSQSDSLGAIIGAGLSEDAIFVSAEVSVEATSSVSIQESTSVERTVTEGVDSSNEILAHIEPGASGNELCLEVFLSPFSGTFVYRVCGGITSCPHIDGTDAREALALTTEKNPDTELTENEGSFSFRIDTSTMPNDDDSIDLRISVDSESATGSIAYTVGASSLHQPIDITMDAGTDQVVTVFYERLDELVLSSTVVITVASACDESISRSLSFRLNWATECPAIDWDGALLDPAATWALTSSSPTLPLAFSRGQASDSSVSSTVTLWATRFVGSTIDENSWFQVPSFGPTSPLTLAQFEATGVAEGRFLLELRATCASDGRGAGSAFSSRRLGVFDTTGPILMNWAPVSSVKTGLSSFPMATFRFDEPVDCAHDDLQAIVTDDAETMTFNATIVCAGQLYDLTVAMVDVDAEKAAAWSNSTVKITLQGIHDLFGNAAEDVVAGSRRRRVLAAGAMTKKFVVPELPVDAYADTASLVPWVEETLEMKQQAVQAKREQVLPSELAQPGTNKEQGDVATSSDDSQALAIGLGVSAAVVIIVVSTLAVLWRRRRQAAKVPEAKTVEDGHGFSAA